MRGLTSSRLALLVALACGAFPSGAAANRSTYDYAMTLEGSGSATFDYPGGCCHEYGDESGSYKLTYEVVITIDDERKTVTVGGSPTAQTLEGLSTYHYTSTCADPSCTGPDTVCNWANVPVGQQYLSARNFYLTAPGQYGTTDYGVFSTGAVNLEELVGGVGPGGTPIQCSGTSRVDYPTWEKMPGIKGTFSIPVSRLGERHFVLDEDSDPSYAHNTYTPTASWHYTITLDLLGPNTRITEAKLDFSERALRRRAQLKAQLVPLAERKAQLEDQIVDDSAKAKKLADAVGQLQPELTKVKQAIADEDRALKKLKRAEGKVPPELESLFEAEDRYAEEVASLEQRILAARQKGKDVASLSRDLRAARKRLDSIEEVLKEKLRGSEVGATRAKWIARLRTLKSRLFDLLDENARLVADQAAVEARLTDAAANLRAVDSSLLDIGDALVRFDPEVRGVTAVADGQTVFHATATYSYAALLAINEAIAAQDATVARLKAGKAAAFNQFKAAQDDASNAQKRLAELIWNLALAHAGVDLTFDLVDLLEATAKGGIVGAGAEGGKKLVEGLIKLKLPSPKEGLDPDSIQAELNKEFDAQLKDPFSAPQIGRAVGEHVLSNTIGAAVKDTANQYLGSKVFDKFEYPYRFRLNVEPNLLPGTAVDYARAEAKLAKLDSQLQSLRKGFLNNFKGSAALKDFMKGAAANIAKDALKHYVHGTLDRKEQEAWFDFFFKDSIARAMFVPYAAWANVWRTAELQHDALVAQKAALIGSLDAGDGVLSADVSTPFLAFKNVDITLDLNHEDPNDPLHVLVNGVETTRNGNTFTLPGGAVSADTLSIAIR